MALFTSSDQKKIAFLLLTFCMDVSFGKTSMLDYRISRTWDGDLVEKMPIELRLTGPIDQGIQIEIKAPFYDDSDIPPGKSGEPVWKLWDYEVVEAFFLGDDTNYLELEFSPYGCHLALLLRKGDAVNFCLPLQFSADINDDRTVWQGIAHIPAEYFPKNVTKFNAYAIHGKDESRTYLALHPVPKGKFQAPNFHRLEYFGDIPFSDILPSNSKNELSKIWSENHSPEKGCPKK